jgi:hypothetical protein
MAEVVHTTGAHARASIPLSADQSEPTPDPAVVLIEMWERQIAAWRTLPEDADDLRNAVADMSWSETAAALLRVAPTTAGGALRALRHSLSCVRRYHPEISDECCVPLAENAVRTLEALAAA